MVAETKPLAWGFTNKAWHLCNNWVEHLGPALPYKRGKEPRDGSTRLQSWRTISINELCRDSQASTAAPGGAYVLRPASYVQKSPRQHQQPQRTGSADSSDHVIAVPDCASRPLSCQQHRDDHHSGASQRQLSSFLAAASRHSPFRCRTASVPLFHGSWRQLYRPTPPPTNLCSNISTSTSTPLLPDVVDSLPRPSYTSSIPAGNRCRHEKSLCRLRLPFFSLLTFFPRTSTSPGGMFPHRLLSWHHFAAVLEGKRKIIVRQEMRPRESKRGKDNDFGEREILCRDLFKRMSN